LYDLGPQDQADGTTPLHASARDEERQPASTRPSFESALSCSRYIPSQGERSVPTDVA